MIRKLFADYPNALRRGFAITALLVAQVSPPAVAQEKTSAPAPPCICSDSDAMQHRLEEVTALKSVLQSKLQAAGANDPATHERWQAVQADSESTSRL